MTGSVTEVERAGRTARMLATHRPEPTRGPCLDRYETAVLHLLLLTHPDFRTSYEEATR